MTVIDDCCDIMRGIWFFDSSWMPLEATVAEEIEKEHLVKFKGKKIEESVASDSGKSPG